MGEERRHPGPRGRPMLGPTAGNGYTPYFCTPNAWARLAQGVSLPGLLAPFCPPPPALSLLLLFPPHSGTFNPSFDGQPRRDFFHILNLLAPANHLNLPPCCTPNWCLLKDTGHFSDSQWESLERPQYHPHSHPNPRQGGGVQHVELFLRRLLCAVSW